MVPHRHRSLTQKGEGNLPTYKYVAVNLQKQKFKGKYIAENEKDLAVQLAKQNLYLVSASEYKGGTPSAFWTLGTGQVSLAELTGFCRQFAIMISSGIQVPDCLDLLRAQSYSGYFKSIIAIIADDVRAGSMLCEALEKHKKVFPSFFISMCRVGEASGKLEKIFVSLADYYESDTSIRRKAKSALTYPLILLTMTIGIVALMLVFVVPTFKDVLAELEVVPTGFTAAVYAVSDFLVAYWRIIVMVVLLIAIIIFLLLLTKRGKYAYDVFKVKAPVIGKITVGLITARFARAFSILLSSGMDLASALDVTLVILGNRYLEVKFKEASDEVRRGVALTDAFRKYNLFPEMLLQMLTVAERTNSLEEVLERSCGHFDEQVEISLHSITTKIEPIMLVLMGAVVGTLFIAVYSPMLTIMNGLNI